MFKLEKRRSFLKGVAFAEKGRSQERENPNCQPKILHSISEEEKQANPGFEKWNLGLIDKTSS
jgi:hypothetical protein